MLAAGFAAVAVLVVPLDGWWLPLHLFVVGSLLGAISAVTQMLAVTWSAGPPPSDVVAGIQRWGVAGGTVALAIGHERNVDWMFVAGGVAVAAAMALLAGILVYVRRGAVVDRFAPAIEAYVAAISFGTIGMTLGLLIGSGNAGNRAIEFREAHLTLNVFGLVGLVIAATLPYFVATQVRSKMSRTATPLVLRATFSVLVAATAIAAAGRLVDRPILVASGLGFYAIGLAAIVTQLPIYSKKRLRWAGPRIAQLLAGIIWWMAMTIALAAAVIDNRDERALLQALVIGGFAQILVASLAYLGPVLRKGNPHSLSDGFAIAQSWPSVAAGTVAGIAALAGHHLALAIALTVWLVDTGIRAVRLVVPMRRRQPAGATDVP